MPEIPAAPAEWHPPAQPRFFAVTDEDDNMQWVNLSLVARVTVVGRRGERSFALHLVNGETVAVNDSAEIVDLVALLPFSGDEFV